MLKKRPGRSENPTATRAIISTMWWGGGTRLDRYENVRTDGVPLKQVRRPVNGVSARARTVITITTVKDVGRWSFQPLPETSSSLLSWAIRPLVDPSGREKTCEVLARYVRADASATRRQRVVNRNRRVRWPLVVDKKTRERPFVYLYLTYDLGTILLIIIIIASPWQVWPCTRAIGAVVM